MLRVLFCLLLLSGPVCGQIAGFNFNPTSATVDEGDPHTVDLRCSITSAFPNDRILAFAMRVKMVELDFVGAEPHEDIAPDTTFFSAAMWTSAAGDMICSIGAVSDYGFSFSGNDYDGSFGSKNWVVFEYVGTSPSTTAKLEFDTSYGNPLGGGPVLRQEITYQPSGAGSSGPYFPTYTFPLSYLVTVNAAEFDFKRGDSNGDSTVNIADTVNTLGYLFPGGVLTGTVLCEDAADVNDDGIVNVADPIALLAYLFASGSAPASPGLTCGADPTTSDSLDCDVSPCP